jgi:hypothetical protein
MQIVTEHVSLTYVPVTVTEGGGQLQAAARRRADLPAPTLLGVLWAVGLAGVIAMIGRVGVVLV